MSENLIITPKTKVLQLIEAYPDLEEVLIEYVPAFSKLKNPFLRKTVAKVTTLQQAALVGNVKVEDLINHLRKIKGQGTMNVEENTTYNTHKPDWFAEEKIAAELDARPMLAAGEHPVAQVMAELKTMEAGKIYKLTAPFLPAPLIDKAASLEFTHWIEQKSDSEFNVYFIKKQ